MLTRSQTQAGVQDAGGDSTSDETPPVTLTVPQHTVPQPPYEPTQLASMFTMLGTLIDRMTAIEQTLLHRDDGNAVNAFVHTVPVSQNSEGIHPPPCVVRCNSCRPTPPLRFRDDDQVNPMEFLNSMERYFRAAAIPADNWIRVTLAQLDGMPYNWGLAFEDLWLEWGGFRASFLKMFWSEARQDRIIDELHRSVYDRSVHNSMSELFVYWVKRVKYLSPPMSTRTFLRRITHLFPANVESAILASRLETTEDMLFFLREFDDASARRQERRLVPLSGYNSQPPQRPSDRHDGRSNNLPKERHPVPTGQWRDRRDGHQGRSCYDNSTVPRETNNVTQRDDATDVRARYDDDVLEGRQTTGNGQ